MQQPSRQQLSLFISYRRTDSAFVDRLEVDLRVRDFSTWLDRRDLASRGGANWRRELQIAIDRAHALVLVMTPDAAASPYVGWEYRYARLLNRPIFVLLLKDMPEGVPAETLAPDVRWLDCRREADYPQRLYELVEQLMDLPLDAPSPRPDGVKFGDDAPIALLPLTHPQNPSAAPKTEAELDDLYRRAVQAEIAGNLDRTTDLFQRILNVNPTYRNNFIGNRMPDLLRKRRDVWVERLTKIAYQARLEGEWGLEIAAWNAAVTETNGDPRAQKGLTLAKQNQSFAWLYKEALSAYNNGDLAAAKLQLEQLWAAAPDYGDPARLAPELGLSTRQARESTGLISSDLVAEAQAAMKAKEKEKAQAAPPPQPMDELDAVLSGFIPPIMAPFPLMPNERVIRAQPVTWFNGVGWNQRIMFLTTLRLALLPADMSPGNPPPFDVALVFIANIERAMLMMINPVVKFTLQNGSEIQFMLTDPSTLSYGNREAFITLVRRLMTYKSP